MSVAGIVMGFITAGAVGVTALLSGCASPGIEEYKDNAPRVDVREYLNGKLVAFGSITDFRGKVTDRFTAQLEGSWEGNKGTLKEDFTYDDGHKEQRIWSFTLTDDGRITGTAHDIIGEATGRQLGNAIFMEYVLERERNGSKMRFTMDDRLYLIDETYLINHTRIKKFGITVATLDIGFHKLKN